MRVCVSVCVQGLSIHTTPRHFLLHWLCWCEFGPTSLQSVLGDGAAVDAQAGSGEGSHLDLVLCPDDQILQQAVVGLRAADVLLLVVPWQPSQTVPTHTRTHKFLLY